MNIPFLSKKGSSKSTKKEKVRESAVYLPERDWQRTLIFGVVLNLGLMAVHAFIFMHISSAVEPDPAPVNITSLNREALAEMADTLRERRADAVADEPLEVPTSGDEERSDTQNVPN